MEDSSFIILSAQPDRVYYEWQLEIQFINLLELGYDLSNYHVLIGYFKTPGEEIRKLAARYPNVNWGFYQDTRLETRSYVSSIRPHIIKKHFEQNPWLSDKRIFYIDSDVIFRELPPLWQLNDPDTWYFSRTDYIAISGIKEKGDHISTDMCRIVGIDPALVEANAQNSGGAQSWINNTNAAFWHKMEVDSTRLYDYLKLTWPIAAKLWSKKIGKPLDEYVKVYEYLADMWVILWNGLLLGKQLKVETVLDFCTPTQNLDAWESCYLLHYSVMRGTEAPEYFKKNLFSTTVDLNWIPPEGILRDVCASKYVDYLEKMITLRKSLN